jgi:hypothetical protein
MVFPCLFALALPVAAVICTIDDVPAATLLLPYFEVDLGTTGGIDTVFSVNNASNQEVLAKVDVWSDLGVDVFGFNVHLNAFGSQVIDLRDVLVNGQLPATQPGSFASCAGALPPPPISAFNSNSIRRALTGLSAPAAGNLCAGLRYFDNVARGYVTVNAVNNCSLRSPVDAGYFGAGGTGDATNQNVLWGDYSFSDSAKGFSHSDTLVHIEASATNPETSTSGQYTFWGRYVAWSAVDNREPLSTHFGARYVRRGTSAATSGGTDLLVWRDSKVNQGYFTCSAIPGRPSWYPLGQGPIVVCTPGGACAAVGGAPFPAAAQRTAVGFALLAGQPSLAVPNTPAFLTGTAYLSLNATIAGNPNPPEDPAAAQAWATAVTDAGTTGTFSTGHEATRFDSACQAIHP